MALLALWIIESAKVSKVPIQFFDNFGKFLTNKKRKEYLWHIMYLQMA